MLRAMRHLALLLLLTGCFSLPALDDGDGGDGGVSGVGGSSTTTGGAGGAGYGGHATGGAGGSTCAGLDYCGCVADAGCRVVAEDCFCPGSADGPCAEDIPCGCGGGVYLGCADRRCAATSCPAGSRLEYGPDGCPTCIPPCEGLEPCDCFARDDCEAVTDSCICECGDFTCPGVEPCDCGCGGGEYLGCRAIP